MSRSIVDVVFQIQIYKKYKNKIFQENGKALPCSDKIYSTLTQELIGMTPKAIQTSINRLASSILSDEKDQNPFEFVAFAEGSEISRKKDELKNQSSEECDNADSSASSKINLSRSLEQSNNDESSNSHDDEHRNNALYDLYHPKTSQSDHAEEELKHELISLNKGCSKIKNCFASQKSTVDRLTKRFDDLIKIHQSKEETLRSEIEKLRQINEVSSSKLIAISNELKVSEQSRLEIIDREKLAVENLTKIHQSKEETLRSEIEKLRQINEVSSSKLIAISNELKVSEQSRLEIIDREKLAVENLTKIHQSKEETLRSEIEKLQQIKFIALKQQSHKLPQDEDTDTDTGISDSELQLNKRKRKLTNKYFGTEWSN